MPTANRHTIVVGATFWDDIVKAAAKAGADRGKAMSISEWLRAAALQKMIKDQTR